MLQELHYQGVLKEGDRWTFSGPGLIEIVGIRDPGRWGDGYLDVRVRDTYSGREATKIIAKSATF